MTDVLEHLNNALGELQEAYSKADGEIGTQMMVDELIDEVHKLISRYERINEDGNDS